MPLPAFFLFLADDPTKVTGGVGKVEEEDDSAELVPRHSDFDRLRAA
jgi:hypothetical protein